MYRARLLDKEIASITILWIFKLLLGIKTTELLELLEYVRESSMSAGFIFSVCTKFHEYHFSPDQGGELNSDRLALLFIQSNNKNNSAACGTHENVKY